MANNTESLDLDGSGRILIGDSPPTQPALQLHRVCQNEGTAFRFSWSPSGHYLASANLDGPIRVWEIGSGAVICEFESPGKIVQGLSWSPDGNMLAVSCWQGGLDVWNINEKKQVCSTGVVEKYIGAIAWSPRESTIAYGLNSRLHILDSETLRKLKTFKEHSSTIKALAWSKDGERLASGSTDKSIRVWDINRGETVVECYGHESSVCDVIWSADERRIISGSWDKTVRVWNVEDGRLLQTIEGHSKAVYCLALLDERVRSDRKVLVSQGRDKLIFWEFDTLRQIGTLPQGEADWRDSTALLAAHPTLPRIATAHDGAHSIAIWDYHFGTDGDDRIHADQVAYTSAKIVLVGESNVGKSCLAMRLAEDRYPEDNEQGTTHGMQFWPMEAEELHPQAKPPEGQRRDVVLWDFGGQDEYRLVHQLFLHDTTLALVLIDPTRGRAALDEARDWNKQLEKHLGTDKAVKLLVGAKVDRKSKLIDLNSIEALRKECRFAAFVDLSSKTGRNTKKLRKVIADALDWDQMAKTSRPELFQHIRDDVERRRKRKEIVLTLETFKRAIKRSAAKLYEEAAVEAVSDQLATQGIIVRTKLTGGDEALVLQLPVIERYAGSLIIAARNNPRGVPVLEERLLGATKTIPLPGMTKKDRLSPAKERMVLECIVELMIQHGICFRHGGLLVFPTLFPAGGTDDEKLTHSVSLYYDFTGAIDNIYASLVSKLMVSEEFGEGRLRAGCVEFERGRQGVCGVHQIKRTGGRAHLDLFFSEKTKPARRDLFTRFVEEHLRLNGVDIREHQAMTCKCGEEISERIVQTRISAGEKDVVCPICETKTAIGVGADRIRERSPETDAKMVALRKTIDKKLAEDVESAKKAVAGHIRTAKAGEPIRILHLSDLHFAGKTNPDTKLQLLLQDIRREDEEYAAIETVEYLVISGDITDKGKDVGFEKARQFVDALVSELGLSTQRCIFVPGNHDVQDRKDAYEERETEDGSTIKVRHPENFPKRFERFSNGFFHPLLHKDYPLSYAEQGISYLFADTGIQFLTVNSAWQIDKNGRKKAGIHPDAVAGVIARGEDELKRATERGDLEKNQEILRIGVWHHAVAGPELMKDLGFLTQLQKAGMQLCLHGDVHEARTGLFGYRQAGIDVEIVGAGSFGSAAEGRPEATPRLYNILEVSIAQKSKRHMSIRVHTRCQKKAEEAWQGYHEWKNPDGKGRVPYYDIDLT